ncbi:MAG: hypothetical protein WCW87_02300 [Candidatus Paceibacterota bacterium]
MQTDIFVSIFGESLGSALQIIFYAMPLWLPFLAGFVFWKLWVQYVRGEFISKQKYTLLEIKLPKELFKSPQAMETVLAGLYLTMGESTWFDKYWLGKIRTWFSLELVSIDGNVHFFIWTRDYFKNTVESQIYAQYPTVEIYEVPDYTQNIYFDPNVYSVFGTFFKLTKPDPYPIKTYVDYGMDKDPKEEFKIDPIVSVTEFLGSLNKGEQAWIQILIRAHKKEKRDGLFSEPTDWKTDAKAEIKKIMTEGSYVKSEGDDPFAAMKLTRGQQDVINAMERSINKQAFDTGIRAIYIAEKDKYNATRIPGILGVMRQYNSSTLNSFGLSGTTGFDFPWEDYKDIRLNKVKKDLVDGYKLRSYFHPPFKKKPFVLNTEELATIFHFPGGVATTPTVSRITSKKAEPPSNLPI